MCRVCVKPPVTHALRQLHVFLCVTSILSILKKYTTLTQRGICSFLEVPLSEQVTSPVWIAPETAWTDSSGRITAF